MLCVKELRVEMVHKFHNLDRVKTIIGTTKGFRGSPGCYLSPGVLNLPKVEGVSEIHRTPGGSIFYNS